MGDKVQYDDHDESVFTDFARPYALPNAWHDGSVQEDFATLVDSWMCGSDGKSGSKNLLDRAIAKIGRAHV